MELARELGLKDMPPSTPSPGAIASMLKYYGPLWFAGLHPSGHVVVITGITSSKVLINDSWPVGKGERRTITFNRFGEILQPLEEASFGLSQAKLAANLLHFPG